MKKILSALALCLLISCGGKVKEYKISEVCRNPQMNTEIQKELSAAEYKKFIDHSKLLMAKPDSLKVLNMTVQQIIDYKP
jgi:hypothetical protein